MKRKRRYNENLIIHWCDVFNLRNQTTTFKGQGPVRMKIEKQVEKLFCCNLQSFVKYYNNSFLLEIIGKYIKIFPQNQTSKLIRLHSKYLQLNL